MIIEYVSLNSSNYCIHNKFVRTVSEPSPFIYYHRYCTHSFALISQKITDVGESCLAYCPVTVTVVDIDKHRRNGKTYIFFIE